MDGQVELLIHKILCLLDRHIGWNWHVLLQGRHQTGTSPLSENCSDQVLRADEMWQKCPPSHWRWGERLLQGQWDPCNCRLLVDAREQQIWCTNHWERDGCWLWFPSVLSMAASLMLAHQPGKEQCCFSFPHWRKNHLILARYWRNQEPCPEDSELWSTTFQPLGWKSLTGIACSTEGGDGCASKTPAGSGPDLCALFKTGLTGGVHVITPDLCSLADWVQINHFAGHFFLCALEFSTELLLSKRSEITQV